MDSIQKQHYSARQNQMLVDYAIDQPYMLEIRYHLKCWLTMSENDQLTSVQAQIIFFNHVLYLMNMNYSHSKASSIATYIPYLSLVFQHPGSNHPTSKTS